VRHYSATVKARVVRSRFGFLFKEYDVNVSPWGDHHDVDSINVEADVLEAMRDGEEVDCEAVGKRLCGKIGGGPNEYQEYNNASLSQWYNACTSHDPANHTYPYGSAYQATTCNGYDYWGGSNYTTLAVGTLTGCQSPVSAYQGVFDLTGNLYEWEDSCSGTGSIGNCRIRGGCFANNAGPACGILNNLTRTSFYGHRRVGAPRPTSGDVDTKQRQPPAQLLARLHGHGSNDELARGGARLGEAPIHGVEVGLAQHRERGHLEVRERGPEACHGAALVERCSVAHEKDAAAPRPAELAESFELPSPEDDARGRGELEVHGPIPPEAS
jgi:hypothetical protein